MFLKIICLHWLQLYTYYITTSRVLSKRCPRHFLHYDSFHIFRRATKGLKTKTVKGYDMLITAAKV